MTAEVDAKPAQSAGGREWSVAVITAREDPDLLCAVIGAALDASKGHGTVVDVMVNGNQALSRAAAAYVTSLRGSRGGAALARIWDIALRDKAHAWNEYVHRIWPGSECAFFLDGFARVSPDAFEQLRSSLREHPEALAANAAALREGQRLLPARGALGGNLHAVRGSAMQELRQRRIKLPLGFYWVDGLTGAIFNYRFDPAQHAWNPDNIVASRRAGWSTREKSPWRIGDLRDQFNRMKRQARGRFENRAVRDHMTIKRRSPQAFPETSRDLFVSWMRAHPMQAAWLACKNPLIVDVFLNLRQPQDWSKKGEPPISVATAEI
jgi:hypothetical protein